MLSLSVFTFGFVALAPLLILGNASARHARDDCATAQVATTLLDEVRSGERTPGRFAVNLDGTVCAESDAVYHATVASTTDPNQATLTRLTVTLAPVANPNRMRTYAVVYPTTP